MDLEKYLNKKEKINKNSEKFKEIRKEYFNKMYDFW